MKPPATIVPTPHTMALPGTYTTLSTPAPTFAPRLGGSWKTSAASGCMTVGAGVGLVCTTGGGGGGGPGGGGSGGAGCNTAGGGAGGALGGGARAGRGPAGARAAGRPAR